jgi:NADPH:quinone reductase
MKAIHVIQFGGPEVLQVADIATPQPGTGEVLIRLAAAGVNPVDTYIRSGQYAKLPSLPYTPGTDGAGTIEALGEGVSEFAVGDRVYTAGSITGTYAEYCLCRVEQVHPLPEPVSFSQGAALGIPYATAWRGLMQRGEAQRGETVLIHGATGGVGLAAVQFAMAAGLRVLATGGTEEGRAFLREQGADETFDHHAADYVEKIRSATGGAGVPLILEMLANKNLPTDLQLLSKNGRVVIIGNRGTVEINPRDTMMRDSDIRGFAIQNASPEEMAEAHRAIVEGLRNGTLNPIVASEHTMANAPAAHEEVMAYHKPGKIVLLTQ